MRSAPTALVWLCVIGCSARDDDAVEANNLGISEIIVTRDRAQDGQLLTMRGLDKTGVTIATAVLRTGMVKYGADMPEDWHAGTELTLEVRGTQTVFISP